MKHFQMAWMWSWGVNIYIFGILNTWSTSKCLSGSTLDNARCFQMNKKVVPYGIFSREFSHCIETQGFHKIRGKWDKKEIVRVAKFREDCGTLQGNRYYCIEKKPSKLRAKSKLQNSFSKKNLEVGIIKSNSLFLKLLENCLQSTVKRVEAETLQFSQNGGAYRWSPRRKSAIVQMDFGPLHWFAFHTFHVWISLSYLSLIKKN